ncbi:ABC transporter (plasmid) [Peribacillus muralis]|uniref:ABC transporter n=1 Tax=Peribacillus muralis TaxID=264697 RepID=A0A1B3XW34_9BACI|nr:ABC transporter ATP-binding protein [Peribacillus muralis]AOH57409.1 ABC transporter [Peribacillus muralis]
MLQINNLSKVYVGGIRAVQNFNLKVLPGEIVALAGPNGSGKTTLIGSILNIIKPTTGDVSYLQFEAGTKEFNSISSYIPDELMLPELLTANEYFDFISSIYKNKSSKSKRDTLIEIFDMSKAINRNIETFSHGMRKKTQLISAFMLDVDFIILDEPFRGLDIEAILVLKKLMKNFTNKGKSILIATHDLNIAEEIADRVAIISKGYKVADGKVHELLQDNHCQTIEELFLTVSNLKERSAGYEKLINNF